MWCVALVTAIRSLLMALNCIIHVTYVKCISRTYYYEDRISPIRTFTILMSNIYRNPLAQLEEEKREHDNKMKKMEMEMEQVFEMKVKEKRHKLKDSETDVSKFISRASLISFFVHCKGSKFVKTRLNYLTCRFIIL